MRILSSSIFSLRNAYRPLYAIRLETASFLTLSAPNSRSRTCLNCKRFVPFFNIFSHFSINTSENMSETGKILSGRQVSKWVFFLFFQNKCFQPFTHYYTCYMYVTFWQQRIYFWFENVGKIMLRKKKQFIVICTLFSLFYAFYITGATCWWSIQDSTGSFAANVLLWKFNLLKLK